MASWLCNFVVIIVDEWTRRQVEETSSNRVEFDPIYIESNSAHIQMFAQKLTIFNKAIQAVEEFSSVEKVKTKSNKILKLKRKIVIPTAVGNDVERSGGARKEDKKQIKQHN